jgi:hypothetical protein
MLFERWTFYTKKEAKYNHYFYVELSKELWAWKAFFSYFMSLFIFVDNLKVLQKTEKKSLKVKRENAKNPPNPFQNILWFWYLKQDVF